MFENNTEEKIKRVLASMALDLDKELKNWLSDLKDLRVLILEWADIEKQTRLLDRTKDSISNARPDPERLSVIKDYEN